QELWRTDGTAANTRLVKDILAGASGSAISGLSTDGTSLLFSANDGVLGAELWGSDGTAAGTKPVKDINATGSVPGSASPRGMVRLGMRVLFQADDGQSGAELWTTDGTAAGTQLVKDIAPGPVGSAPTSLTVLGGRVVFIADDGTNGTEQWASDGT